MTDTRPSPPLLVPTRSMGKEETSRLCVVVRHGWRTGSRTRMVTDSCTCMASAGTSGTVNAGERTTAGQPSGLCSMSCAAHLPIRSTIGNSEQRATLRVCFGDQWSSGHRGLPKDPPSPSRTWIATRTSSTSPTAHSPRRGLRRSPGRAPEPAQQQGRPGSAPGQVHARTEQERRRGGDELRR